MVLKLELIEASPHTITNENSPRKGQEVQRLSFLDGDKKNFCRAFFCLDVEKSDKVKLGEYRDVSVSSLNTLNGTVWLKGGLLPQSA